jgi:hypothetical protein
VLARSALALAPLARRAESHRLGGVVSFEPVKTCDFCGRQEADEAKTLTWSTAVEGGRAKTYCETCSRENLRAMEGKLDSEYW